MRELLLDRQIIAAMLGDEAFYTACPFFIHMRELGQACYNKYMATFDQECQGCADAQIMVPAIAEFVAQCRRLYGVDPNLLEPIKDYIATRRPQRPDKLKIQFQESGKVRKLTF